MRDYSKPILKGTGSNDYARYMRVETLLSLQQTPEEMLHRDELLFQTVHQSTELWLKHACYEVAEAIEQVKRGTVDSLMEAESLLARAAFGVQLITQQLEMLRFMSPWDFQSVRPALGNGSGFESPGWISVRRRSEALKQEFMALLENAGVDLDALYKTKRPKHIFRLAEAIVEWDERVSLWRARHYKVATRTIGHNTVGTKGTPVDQLAKLLNHKFFPELWDVRTRLTQSSAESESCPMDGFGENSSASAAVSP